MAENSALFLCGKIILMLDFIDIELVVRRKFKENPELTREYRKASLTPGEWKSLDQVGDPVGLAAKNETVVSLPGGVEEMVKLVDRLHKKPFGKVKPGVAEYKRTGLQMIVDWIGYLPDGLSDDRVRYYDSTKSRMIGSRVEILDVKLDDDEVSIMVMEPSTEMSFGGITSFSKGWNEAEFLSTPDDEPKAFMLAAEGSGSINSLKKAIRDGGIPFRYTETVGYALERDESGRLMRYPSSKPKKYHLGVRERKPAVDQPVLAGKYPNRNIKEIRVGEEEAEKMFQRLVIPK